ncbi:MAG: DUF3604 domain-containing protein, partial [bacterium]|nr:DUF3604 domain-containing protein [bacterium]
MAIHNLSHSLQPFYGDIHNHCDISYGHGPLEDAYANARMQLDFASVTGHSSWPDLPERDDRLAAVVDYHRNGFQKLENNWRQYVDVTETQNTPGQFVTLFSYEWHSLRFGDYVVYFKKPIEKMLKPSNLEEFRSMLQEQRKRGNDALLIPHHIGYKTGYRGINWEAFTEEFSPAVEIISMHGCAESDDAPRNYFHTMGPRNAKNTLQAGLAAGYHVAVTGSTDHHSAHPGSFGYGLTGVWAESLTRDSLWNAIKTRRTWALTGDRISLAFSINGYPLGSVLPFSKERKIEVEIRGGYSLNYIEILKNNR